MGIDRREFLRLSGVGVAGVFILPLMEGCESHAITPFVEPKPEPFLTPVSQFFEQNGGEGAITGWTRPVFASPNDWSLVIKNRNTIIATVTYDELMTAADEPGVEVTLLKTIECVLQSEVRVSPTGFSGNAYWTGVPLQRFLGGIDLSATTPVKRLVLTGADRFVNNIKPERIFDAESMGLVQPLLVYKINGEELPPEHGFPVRLIIQEAYGYKNVKWLTEVQAVNVDINFGTYQGQGFIDDGVMRVNSRATSLFDKIRVSAGPSMIFGFALSGFASIEKVEIGIDGGPVGLAEIVPFDEFTANLPPNIKQIVDSEAYPFLGVWTPWRFAWDAVRGDHTIAIRAFDTAGNMQPDSDDNINDGQNGVTTYRVSVT